MKTSPTMSNDEKCRFSLISVILPSIQKRQSHKFFKIAMNHLHDYLDIRKIVKRFHILDTLSLSLLTESPPLRSKVLYEGAKSKFKEKNLLLNCKLDRINFTSSLPTRKQKTNNRQKLSFLNNNSKELVFK